jgi:hypothetical protein
MFGDDTLAESSTALIMPASALAQPPKLIDRVALDGGTQFRVVVEVKPIMGPGDAGPAVLIAYAIALGGIVEQEDA